MKHRQVNEVVKLSCHVGQSKGPDISPTPNYFSMFSEEGCGDYGPPAREYKEPIKCLDFSPKSKLRSYMFPEEGYVDYGPPSRGYEGPIKTPRLQRERERELRARFLSLSPNLHYIADVFRSRLRRRRTALWRIESVACEIDWRGGS